MAVKVVKHYFCDLCDTEVTSEDDLKGVHIPIKFHTEQNEGRPCEPYFVNQKMDLCITCLEKITVIHAKGAQGYNEYWVKKESEIDE